ncbi:hypothetical protein FDUTEX481_01917 [Tolypothrix sp. PCC 7601]|nr:hypothetical protein FDUTEX481_01917 [Tolypothrix sp. PCC 7601]
MKCDRYILTVFVNSHTISAANTVAIAPCLLNVDSERSTTINRKIDFLVMYYY